MNEEEKKVVEHLKETSKDRIIIPLDDEILIAVYLIEKLQKENEELENDNKYLRERESYLEKRREDIINIFQNQQTNTTIPVQKVKDKIEELNQYYKKEIYPNLYQWRDITITEHYDEMIELLQELLGDK